MNNKYGVDENYFREKLELLLRDLHNYTPLELYNTLTRLANVVKKEEP